MAPLIVAHRGGAPHLGENSADACASGMQSGADMLEMDVQQSADGHLIVLHDARVPGTDGDPVTVARLTLSELRGLRPNVMLFDEFLDQFCRFMPTNVDVKGTGFEEQLVRSLRRHRLLEKVLISSTSARSLRKIKILAPEPEIGLSRGQIVPWLDSEPQATFAALTIRPTLPVQLLWHGKLALADTFMLNFRLIQPWLVRFLHDRGYRVFCWTVNDPEWAEWLAEAGVDGITSDYPELMVDALRSQNCTGR